MDASDFYPAGLYVPFVAGEDLTDQQNLLVKAGASGLQVMIPTSYLDRPVALSLGTPVDVDQEDAFVDLGQWDVFCGAAAPAYGDQVVMDDLGAVIPAIGARAGSWLVGWCLSDGAAPGDLISVNLDLRAARQLYLRTFQDFMGF